MNQPAIRLDKTDRAIAALLQYDGRLPFTTIADQVGVSEGTVRNRVARMREAGVLQVVGVVDPHLLDLQATCVVGVNVEPARLDEAAQTISLIRQLVEEG